MLKRGIAATVSVLAGLSVGLSQSPLRNETIVKLSNSSLSDDAIIQIIDQQGGTYSLSTVDVRQLKEAGVSDRVLSALLKKSTEAAPEIKVAPAPTVHVTLVDGTKVRLRLRDGVSSSGTRAGDRVEFEIVSDVKCGSVVILHHGDLAMGTVKQAEPKRLLGRGGKVELTVDYARLSNGERVQLTGRSDSLGPRRTALMTGGAAATSLVAWPLAPLFLLIHGKDTEIPAGTELDAYVQGDVEFDLLSLSQEKAHVSNNGVPRSESTDNLVPVLHGH